MYLKNGPFKTKIGLITSRLSTLSPNGNYIWWIKYVQCSSVHHIYYPPHRTTNQLLILFQLISEMYKYTRLSSQNFQDLRFFLLCLYPHGRVLMHSLFWEVVLDMKVIYVRYVDWLKRSMWSCKLEGILMSTHFVLSNIL